MNEQRDPFGPEAHDEWAKKNGHSCKRGHYCIEWDGLWICEDCGEFQCCRCFEQEEEEEEPKK